MAKLFKNRSDNDIKNKWYSMMRKQKRISDQLLNEFAPMVASSGDDTSVTKTRSSRGDSKPSPLQARWETRKPTPTYPVKSTASPDIGTPLNSASV
jgi:hypothetical protein